MFIVNSDHLTSFFYHQSCTKKKKKNSFGSIVSECRLKKLPLKFFTAYFYVDQISDEDLTVIQRNVLQRAVDGMREDGAPYVGVV